MKDHVPAFVIFHESVLLEISSARPRTLAALSRIKGIGESKMSRYGEEILGMVGKASSAGN
jgi:ATP-dependent DNA helicase RecQ